MQNKSISEQKTRKFEHFDENGRKDINIISSTGYIFHFQIRKLKNCQKT